MVVVAVNVAGGVGTNKTDVIPMIEQIEASLEGGMLAGVMTVMLLGEA